MSAPSSLVEAHSEHTPSPRRRQSAVPALARVEAVRLLRHPAFLVAIALYLAPWLYDLAIGDPAHRFPVLHDASWSSQFLLLLPAAGVLLAANQAALRSQRHGAEEAYQVLVVDRVARAGAHLLSLVPAVLGALVLSALRIAYLAAQPGAAGEVRPLEVLAGPACVLLAGCAGVLASTITRSAAAAPLLIVGLAAVTVTAAVNDTAAWRWLSLIANQNENASPLPTPLIERPAGTHLLWLTCWAALLAVAALLVSRLRSPSPRGPVASRAVAVVALVGILVTGILQISAGSATMKDREAAYTRHPAAYQTCDTRAHITYCAFPDFTSRVGEWAQVTAGVLRNTPPTIATDSYAVRQRVFPSGAVVTSSEDPSALPPLADWAADDLAAGTPNAVTVDTDWSEGAAGGDRGSDAVLAFAASFAYRAVVGTVPDQPRLTMVCGARAMLVVWLAAQATPGTADALASLRRRSFGPLTLPLLGSAAGLAFEPQGQDLAFALVDHPPADLAERIIAGWDQLSAADTSAEQAADLLGIHLPTSPDDYSEIAGC
ncbi:hypothetical protein HDA40_002721 [Hamadaea flava]|uniref:ABC transporter permease n=1 Tax=Hamadaea flava TaxID=1742688 RepID=A0ABV8LGQ8_9ACTN|nr:hypothetical protein [Hamadaea flava]MCP2324214.1 hypothetical protein [Hamadaea flava]